MITTVLETKGQAALVEYQDAMGPHRVIVPASKAAKEMDFEVLEHGIIYGVPWEHIIMLSVSSTQIARLLRERGIWTEKDLQKNVVGARSALADAYGIDLKNLLDSVRNASAEN